MEYHPAIIPKVIRKGNIKGESHEKHNRGKRKAVFVPENNR
jgi:hypothetical protein